MRPVFSTSVAVVLMAVGPAVAQQVTVQTPYHASSDGFFERMGVDWDFQFGGVGGPWVSFGRSLPGFGGDPGGAMRGMLDLDGERSAVVGLQAPGVFSPNLMVPFSQNSYGLAVPQFGGYDPAAGMTSGFHVRHGNFQGSLNWTAGAGYRQTLTSQTPSVTLTNGYPGAIYDTSVSPFVMGFIPVVGGIPTVPPPFVTPAYPGYPITPMQPSISGGAPVAAFRQRMAAQGAAPVVGGRSAPARGNQPAQPAGVRKDRAAAAALPLRPAEGEAAGELAAAQASSAGQAVPSVAEARRLHQLEQSARHHETLALFERGQTAEEDGRPEVAKIFYHMALQTATGELRQRIMARLKALGAAGVSP